MNSFDVFDTLLIRRYGDNKRILKELLGDNYTKRIQADNGQRNLYKIYEEIGLTREDAKREIMAEANNSYLNVRIANHVKHGDILISDMYIPGYDILQMLRHNGFDKVVTIYQSNGDKANGKAFQMAKELGVTDHFGDNEYSDIMMAELHGIKGHHIKDAVYQCKDNIELNYFIRELQMRINPKDKNLLKTIQIALPLALFAIEAVRRKAAGRPIVFLGRDCQIMHKLFTSIYNEMAYYVPFSRKMAIEYPRDAAQYLMASAPDDSIYVDLSSTGNTWSILKNHFDRPIYVLIYSDDYHYTDHKPILPDNFSYFTTNTSIGSSSDLIETFFCGAHDCATRVDIEGNMMAVSLSKEDYNEFANDIHVITYIASQIAKYYNLRSDLEGMSDTKLKLHLESYVTLIHNYDP
jgi:hypothetical protein